MLLTFKATLNPMLMLFLCIAIGFALNRAKILPDGAGKVMAKLLTWVFFPALNFTTMARHCTVESLKTNGFNLLFGSLTVALAVAIAIPLSRFFVKERSPERGVYQYALAFGNQGYVGDPVVQAVFGSEILSYYKIFCLPSSLVIYSWGISIMTPGGGNRAAALKKIINAPTVATLTGMVVGLSGLGNHLPVFLSDTLGKLSGCMGPTAMLLAGYTVATYSITKMLKKGKVYVATALRLSVLPAILIAALFGVKVLIEQVFSTQLSSMPLFLAFFAFAAPLGLNTVVFPESFGGDPEPGAAMAMISHTLCVLTIPLLYALMVLIFGKPTI